MNKMNKEKFIKVIKILVFMGSIIVFDTINIS